MDFLTMKHDGVGWVVDDMIEDFSSLIWTERYLDASEFELKTADVANTLAAIPPDGLVTIRESDEVMIVDTLEIKKNEEGVTELVAKGRGYETFLNRRATRNTVSVPAASELYPSNLAVLYIWGGIQEGYSDWAVDAVPDVEVNVPAWLTTFPEPPHPEVYSQYPEGLHVTDVYSATIELLKSSDLGLRTIRTPEGKLKIDIHWMTDRSGSISFRNDAGHLSEESYLWSDTDFYNVAYVVSPIGFRIVYAPGFGGATGQMNRRVLQVNASDITSAGGMSAAAVLDNRGRQELAKHRRIKDMDGVLSPDAPWKYNVDYFLGDKVKMQGQYGLSEVMRVNEYIRVQDLEGERAYPSLITLD